MGYRFIKAQNIYMTPNDYPTDYLLTAEVQVQNGPKKIPL
jgi:hypothetical protein